MSHSQATRRNFLFKSLQTIATLVVANTGIYVVGAAFKNLDGDMVAGAKSCECLCYLQNGYCGYSGPGGGIESCFTTAPVCAPITCVGNSRVSGSCIPN